VAYGPVYAPIDLVQICHNYHNFLLTHSFHLLHRHILTLGCKVNQANTVVKVQRHFVIYYYTTLTNKVEINLLSSS